MPRALPARLEINVAVAMILGRFNLDRLNLPDGKEAVELMKFGMSPVA